MSNRFIPDSDVELASRAEAFATTIAKEPQKYLVSERDAEMMTRAAKAFRAALTTSSGASRSQTTTRGKQEARVKCVQIMRRLGRIIRASDQISDGDKVAVYIHRREARPTIRTVPAEPPVLQFMGASGEGGYSAAGVHWIKFKQSQDLKGRKKPHGAVRVELFVDLVPQGQPIPRFPGEYLGGRPWYLRSFTTSPIRVMPPVPPTPMFVVYWARWADAKGNVGRFSATLKTRVEGWGGIAATPLLGAMPDVKVLNKDPKYIATITQLRQIEQVTVQQLLPDSAVREEAGKQKQLPPLEEAA